MKPPAAAMKPLEAARLARLLRGQRWGCLGTLDNGSTPYVSWAAFVAADDFSALILHLSRLARHSRNLGDSAVVSMALSETDDGQGDPQQLARLTLTGRMMPVSPQDSRHAELKALYLGRLPEAEMLFEFGDFSLYRFEPQTGRYIEGFASSHAITPDFLRTIATL